MMDFKIDRSSFEPIYHQLKEYVKEQILAKKAGYCEGDKITPELEIAKDFNLNVRTVRKAIALLAKEGYVARRRGKGTFVCHERKHTRTKSALNIGILTDKCNFTPTSYAGVPIEAARKRLAETVENPRTLLFSLDIDKDVEKICEDVDGIIVFSDMIPYKVFKEITQTGTKVVSTLTDMSEYAIPSVVFDVEHDAYLQTQYLTMRGHKRIGFVNTPSYVIRNRKRADGYVRALAEADIPLDVTYMRDYPFGINSGKQAVDDFLALADPPTAIVCSSDAYAVGVYQRLQELTINIPGEMAIVGWAGEAETTIPDKPPITSVASTYYKIGIEAVNTLLKLIHGKELTETCLKIKGKLIESRST